MPAITKQTGFFVRPDHSPECYLAKQGRNEFIVYEGWENLDKLGRKYADNRGNWWHKFRCNCTRCDAIAYVRYDVLMVFIAGLVHASKGETS